MADPAIGTGSVLTIDFEASWGVEDTADGKKIGFVSESIVGTQELLENPTIRGDFNRNDPANGKQMASGSLVTIPNVTVAPFFQKLFCGANSTSGAGDPYTHVAKIGTTGPASAVIEADVNIGGTHRYKKANGVRINKWTIPIDAAGFAQWTFEMMGKSVAIGSSAYDASLTDWVTGTPLDHLQLASADVEIGGSAVGYIQSGSIDISANLFGDDYRAGGSGVRGSLVPGTHTVTGSLKLVIDSTAVLTLLTAGTATSLSFVWTAGTNRTFTVSVPRCYLQKVQPGISNGGPIFCDAQFQASYDATAASMLVLTTVNDQAGNVYA